MTNYVELTLVRLTFQEIAAMHAKSCRELIKRFERDITFPTFDAADIGTMDIAPRTEFLLGPSALSA